MNLSIFNTANLFEAATDLFRQLGIKLNSNYSDALKIEDVLKGQKLNAPVYKTIGKTFFIGIIDDSVFEQTGMFDVNYSYKDALQQADKSYEGLMLFALELSEHPNRSDISELTRAFNRISQKMPVALVLKYPMENEDTISISISERFKYKQDWRQGEKAGKVIILRDIKTQHTHAGHRRILLDLVKPVGVTNYAQLHEHWLQVLDVSILNKKFFQELANWYFWAMDNVQFPDDIEKKKDVRNATNLIRLITRVIFIWFIKEKSLIPNSLFNKTRLLKILKDFNKNKKADSYYHAILQNLFFGTLNQKMDERKFVEYHKGFVKADQGVRNIYRFPEKFSITEKEVIELFKDIPFLNGGLFDCLDKTDEETKKDYFVDGFTRIEKKQASVPDYLFFGEETEVDLNEIYATKNKKYKVKGLVNLLESYKFTVAENTPIEEEIALDPELLGKVFENLLASYNPETKTTARKQTGSFYTPREIVNYMVDESLIAYLSSKLPSPPVGEGEGEGDNESRLRHLLAYTEEPCQFTPAEVDALINAINNCKILDPACGSGAFPMGMLHKMVHILQKLDKNNILWKALQRQKAIEETEVAYKSDNREEREKRLIEINDVFDNNASDYGRKLYLIENCIYGIDIQPIAVQIAKLRFFISLIIDQNKQEGNENFGIRSLPNLETKFVAANSLICLDKPEQGMFRNPVIEEKEKELKDLRHNYFTAKTRREKIQYQTKDKKLRKEIAKLLEDDGWNTTVAKQIVAFDPYDQNLSAPFFESEWMFGLTDGFDIVIGNPPYVSAVSMARTNDEKVYFRNKYPEATGSYDIYVLFLLRTLELTSSKGIYSWIIPNKFLIADYSIKTKEKLIKSGLAYSIDVSIYDVFKNTSVYPIIIFGNKLYKDKFIEYLLEQYSDLEIRKFAEPIKLKKYTSFSDLGVKFSSGATGFEAESLKEYLSENETKNSIPFVVSGCIDKYYYNNINVRFMGLKLDHAFIKYSNRIASSKWNFWMQEKIVIAGMTKAIESVYVKSPLALGVGVYAIYDYGKFNPYFLTAILNSKFLTHYINIRFKDKHLAGGYLAINKSTLEKLPLIIPTAQLEKSIVDLSKKILSAKEKNPKADISQLEKQLDEMVYKLYDLTEEEIKIIEGN